MLWKMNCRADVVEDELFGEMRDHGLYLVYMGLESGSETGLAALNKHISVEQNRSAVDTLKRLDIMFDFGFMMLDPSSTFDSIEQNVTFLRDIVGDGYAAAEFCRMVPYDGTPIKDVLAEQGRLRGNVCDPDYDFLDPRLDVFFQRVNRALNVTGWIHGLRALSPALKYAWNEVAVMRGFTPTLDGLDRYRAGLQELTARCNAVLFGVVEELAHACRDQVADRVDEHELALQCAKLRRRLEDERNAFVLHNEDALVSGLLAPAIG
jgi:anaerobic magnesium-protoporphyrin IX monomethyl ester cyclase